MILNQNDTMWYGQIEVPSYNFHDTIVATSNRPILQLTFDNAIPCVLFNVLWYTVSRQQWKKIEVFTSIATLEINEQKNHILCYLTILMMVDFP